MAIRKYRPTTPTTRYKSVLKSGETPGAKAKRSLLDSVSYSAGRSGSGRIAVRRRGGRHKRRYRIIDFKRGKHGVSGVVDSIQYDPNRSANIALVRYQDGEYRYILSPQGLEVGQSILSGSGSPVRVGNAMPLHDVPLGTVVHNAELQPGRGGQLARSAGSFVTVVASDGGYVTLKLPSGEMRKVLESCYATIGLVGNKDHGLVSLGKAGASRHLGRRPKVRGVVMNPVDHPHGGGEGKTSGGRHPVTPWGQPTKGYKTRRVRRISDRFIVQRRAKKRRK